MHRSIGLFLLRLNTFSNIVNKCAWNICDSWYAHKILQYIALLDKMLFWKLIASWLFTRYILRYIGTHMVSTVFHFVLKYLRQKNVFTTTTWIMLKSKVKRKRSTQFNIYLYNTWKAIQIYKIMVRYNSFCPSAKRKWYIKCLVQKSVSR